MVQASCGRVLGRELRLGDGPDRSWTGAGAERGEERCLPAETLRTGTLCYTVTPCNSCRFAENCQAGPKLRGNRRSKTARSVAVALSRPWTVDEHRNGALCTASVRQLPDAATRRRGRRNRAGRVGEVGWNRDLERGEIGARWRQP